MKRRQFMQSIGAAALAPSLPFPAMAAKAATPVVTMSANYTPFMQANALAILRYHETLSFEQFIAKTGLNPAQAEAMLARFAKSGWIGQSTLSGIQAIKPQWMKDIANTRSALANANSTRAASNTARWTRDANPTEPPKFTEIKNCCVPDDDEAETAEPTSTTPLNSDLS